MKFIVGVNGEDREVIIDGESARSDGRECTARMIEIAGTPVHLLMVGDQVHRIVVRRKAGRGQYELWLDGFRLVVDALDERSRAIRELAAARAGPAGPAPLVAPMPGMIVRVNVAEGDDVQTGQGLVVMEAMKMENELRATGAGRIKRVVVTAGTAVEKGALLLELE